MRRITINRIGLFSLFALTAMCCGKGSFHRIQIPASTVWTSTGITVPTNSTILIESVGAISPNGQTYVDANGSTDRDWLNNYNMYGGINHCALIARIGAGGEVQFIGVSQKIRVVEGGILLLGINDSDPKNNEGSFDVSVRIIE